MPKTANGFTVLEPTSPDLATITIGGTAVKVWRPAAKAFLELGRFLHAVEPITEPGWDGGYAHRLVRGSSTTWSEHAAGTALDWNASQHPMGVDGEPGWTRDQVRVIRWWLGRPLGRLFEWGADYKRPDSMHFCLRDRALWDATDGWWRK